jgi:hypothetical protein
LQGPKGQIQTFQVIVRWLLLQQKSNVVD